jgi:hypothetical protein
MRGVVGRPGHGRRPELHRIRCRAAVLLLKLPPVEVLKHPLRRAFSNLNFPLRLLIQKPLHHPPNPRYAARAVYHVVRDHAAPKGTRHDAHYLFEFTQW